MSRRGDHSLTIKIMWEEKEKEIKVPKGWKMRESSTVMFVHWTSKGKLVGRLLEEEERISITHRLQSEVPGGRRHSTMADAPNQPGGEV